MPHQMFVLVKCLIFQYQEHTRFRSSLRDDYEAFMARRHSQRLRLLVDTYDTLRLGVPAAIRVANELGDKINFLGVRIDSGDMAYLSKKIREQLDAAGYPDAKIYASNDLDENTILNLKMQKAKIDVWGVGTKLITAYDQPALGAVYKIVSMKMKTVMQDTIKLSNNAEKVSTQVKQVCASQVAKERKQKVTTSLSLIQMLTNLMKFTCSTNIHLHQ